MFEGNRSIHKQINMPKWTQRAQVSQLIFKNKTALYTKTLCSHLQATQKVRVLIGCSVILKFLVIYLFIQKIITKCNWVTHLALRHRLGQVECVPNWQNYKATSHQTHHSSPL